tara:strand:+ start:2222 stop:4345 length:2124 start_codon:yes stop_codon:yes gene_type:complete
MPLQLLKYDPGIVKDITEYAAGKNGPFWVDGDLVRFRNGYPTKIGGWQEETILRLDASSNVTATSTTITGIARKTAFWRALTDGEDYMAIGTHNHLYILLNGALYDITPLRDKSNDATTTNEALDTSETEIDLVSVTGFKTAGTIKIDSEIITYTGISGLILTGCTRGTNSTAAATHADGAVVTEVLINPIATTSGSKVITITDAAHGASTGDWVAISGATATGGIPADEINDYYGYQITVLTTDTYTITVSTEATSTVSAGGGTSAAIAYLIGIADGLGSQSSDPALGWGVGGWGNDAWNTPRSITAADVALDSSSWNLNLWGEDLIATVRNGGIYYWDTSGGVVNRAVLVSSITGADSVPSVARVTTVSFPDRHFIAAGCQAYSASGGGDVDDMLVRWSTQEDFTKFGPTSLNTAGDQRLQVGTKIVAMVSAREETIISTDEAIYGMTFVGAPFIFSFRLLATDAGAAGLNTMISIDGNVFWMGKRNFFSYDGIVKELPCPVKYYVFDRMQDRYIDKVVVGHNKKFKEITWWYVSNDNTAGTVNPENDSYVTYNYVEGAWSIGTMDRTTWHDTFGSRNEPFAFDPNGNLYDHEIGTSAAGEAMNCFIEGSPRELTAEGENLYMIDKIVPNVTMSTNTSMDLYLNTRKYPSAPETVKGPFAMTSSTEKLSVRAKGRQISVKFETTGTEDDWSLGDFRINTRADGMR